MKYETFLGDSLEVLKAFPENSFDSLVTDPPAGIGLMGLEWDKDKGGRDEWIKWLTAIMKECHRVLKPGAHGFVWAIPRTSHWTGTALEDAGFQVKDVVTHIFGSGFPKSVAIDKAMDRAKHADTDLVYKVTSWIRQRRDELGLTNREIDEITGVKGGASHWTAGPTHGQPHIPTKERWEKLEPFFGPPPEWMAALIRPSHDLGENWKSREIVGAYARDAGGLRGVTFKSQDRVVSEPTHEGSKRWRGWGTALKPASEHWLLTQKPVSEHNIAANVNKYGTGGLNIDGSRVPVRGEKIPSTSNLNFRDGDCLWDFSKRSERSVYRQHPKGRFPSNIILTPSGDETCPAKIMNKQSGRRDVEVSTYFHNVQGHIERDVEDETSFVYCKKSDTDERGLGNHHPTVKPLNLMRYLIRMSTPLEGVVLDPFMGSGSTGVAALLEGFQFLGIEQSEEYFQIASRRLKGVKDERRSKGSDEDQEA